MTDNQRLSTNERIGDPEEMHRLILQGHQAGLQTALPCIVDSFNPALSTIACTPAIKASLRHADGSLEMTPIPQLVDVPVIWPGGGGFTLTFPIKAGDECVVIFASRSIDAWWQAGGVQAPIFPRMHDLSDGFALVGVRSKKRAIAVSGANVQLRGDGGATYIEMTATGVNIVSATLTHNGKNIGATHTHGGVQTGAGITGVPT